MPRHEHPGAERDHNPKKRPQRYSLKLLLCSCDFKVIMHSRSKLRQLSQSIDTLWWKLSQDHAPIMHFEHFITQLMLGEKSGLEDFCLWMLIDLNDSFAIASTINDQVINQLISIMPHILTRIVCEQSFSCSITLSEGQPWIWKQTWFALSGFKKTPIPWNGQFVETNKKGS